MSQFYIFYELSNSCSSDGEIYRGCTDNLSARMADHRQSCLNPKNKGYNSKKAQYIRDHGGWEKWKYEVIERAEKQNMSEWEARWRERYLIKSGRCTLNTVLPIITDEERLEKRKIQAQKIAQRYIDDAEYREKIKKVNRDRYHNNEAYRLDKINRTKEKYWASKLISNIDEKPEEYNTFPYYWQM